MSDKKISQLEKLKNIDGTEQIPVAKNGANYSITPNQIFNYGEYYNKEQADEMFAKKTDIPTDYVSEETYNADKQEIEQSIQSTNTKVEEIETKQSEDLSKITELQGKLNGIGNVQDELDKKADKSDVYTKQEADGKFLTEHQDISGLATKSDVVKQLLEKLDVSVFTERMQSISEQIGTKADATTVADILKLIPTQASATNQLADKDFVNSSIATNTAEFKGTFNSLQELKENAADADANDYGFVISTDTAGNTVYNRYKYVEGTGWIFEYKLNNSSFTAAQFAALNSGVTAELIEKLSAMPNANDILTGKQAAAKYYPLTDGQDLEHLVETLNQGLGQVEEDMKGFVKKSGDTMSGALTIQSATLKLYRNSVDGKEGVIIYGEIGDDSFRIDRVNSDGTFINRLISARDGNILIGKIGSPEEKLDVVGNIKGNQFISRASGSIAPLSVTSTTKVDNLNADMVDGKHDGEFTAAKLAKSVTLWGQSFDGSGNVGGALNFVSDIYFGNAYNPQTWEDEFGDTHAFYGISYCHTNNNTAENVYHTTIADYFGITLKTGPNGFFTFNNAGNLGIGTTTPTEKLDVAGNIKTSGHLITTPTTTTDISKVPTTSQMCVVNTSTSGTFGLKGTMTAGTELQVIINNTGSEEITITIPDTFKANGLTEIAISAGNYGEINVISDGTNLYLRAV